jgi:hypothetical protein
LFYWFWLVLLINKIFPLLASALVFPALLAILFETMEDVLLSKPVASEAGGKGQDKI